MSEPDSTKSSKRSVKNSRTVTWGCSSTKASTSWLTHWRPRSVGQVTPMVPRSCALPPRMTLSSASTSSRIFCADSNRYNPSAVGLNPRVLRLSRRRP
ncbi:hypothetical protein D3C76_859040 [compost metagenome]